MTRCIQVSVLRHREGERRGESECGGAEGIFQQCGVSVYTVLGAVLRKQSLRWAFYANDSWRESWENCVTEEGGKQDGPGEGSGQRCGF